MRRTISSMTILKIAASNALPVGPLFLSYPAGFISHVAVIQIGRTTTGMLQMKVVDAFRMGLGPRIDPEQRRSISSMVLRHSQNANIEYADADAPDVWAQTSLCFARPFWIAYPVTHVSASPWPFDKQQTGSHLDCCSLRFLTTLPIHFCGLGVHA